MVVGPTCGCAGDSGSIAVTNKDCDVADTVSYGGWLGLPVEVLVTVGVLVLLTMIVVLLIGYNMVVVPTCGGAGDSGSIGVADNDCDVNDRVSYGGWTYL